MTAGIWNYVFKCRGGRPSAIGLLILNLVLSSLVLPAIALADGVVVYGDTRTGHEAHRKIVKAIAAARPSVVFHVGDLVEDGLIPGQWDTFFEIASPILDTAEFYPALGNHEKNSRIYFDRFSLPNNERWYSVDYGGVHFIVLDSTTGIPEGSEQHLWLRSDLERNPGGGGFIVVVMHHPIFSSGPHGNDEMGMMDLLVPMFEKYGVDIVFSGHDHDYERLLHNGVHYVVTGGGGAPIYGRKTEIPHSLVFEEAYHFCWLRVDGDRLEVEVIDIDGRTIDGFSVTRTADVAR